MYSNAWGTSLVAQWLKLHAQSTGGLGLILIRKLDSSATKSLHAATEKAPCKPQRRLTLPSATTKPWCGQIIKSIKKKIFGDFTHHVTSDIVARELFLPK